VLDLINTKRRPHLLKDKFEETTDCVDAHSAVQVCDATTAK